MNLKALRLNQGMTVAELAGIVGVPAASVYYWERSGSRPRDAAVAKRVADVFGKTVTELWPLEDPTEAAA